MLISQKPLTAVGVLLLAAAFSIQAQPTSTQSRRSVARAYIGSKGTVHVVLSNGKDVEIPKQKDEVNSSSLAVAEDGQSAGWVVNFKNCCTSYPIPLMLIIYRPDRLILKLGGGMPVWQWKFRKGGKQVAFYTNTVHGDFAPHYELHGLPSGRLIEQRNGPRDEKSPSWMDGLE